MLLTPDEITAIVGTAFVYEVPMIRSRQFSNATGTLRMYQDHFEWITEPNIPPLISVPYEAVETLRVSAHDKPKVQIQACLVGGDHINFMFTDSNKSKDQLLTEQQRARKQLQVLLVRYKKLVSTQERNITQSVSNETDAKRSLLKKSWLLKVLYTNLVVNNVMAPEDFWKMYYKPNEKFLEQPGVSNGFMFEVASDMGASGFRMNLTPEIIRQIYKTYPIVERKYLENVPHLMSEEDFWSKFFQSHYFNRDRIPEYTKNDPFDCVEEDEAQMDQTAKTVVGYRKEKDLLAITDSDGLYSELSELFNPALNDKKKLIRRLNDYSDRILEAGLSSKRDDIVHPKEPQSNGTNGEEPMEVDVPENNGESEAEDIIAEDDPIIAYECYVKKPGIPESSTAATAKETPIPADNSNSDAELGFIDGNDRDSDNEVTFEATTSGRDVPARFRALGLPLDMFVDICDELTASLEAGIENDDEDDDAISLEDTAVVRRMQHEYTMPQNESTMPPMSADLIRSLFCTHTVIFELSTQARKLMAKKTEQTIQQAFTVCMTLNNFKSNCFEELRQKCYDELGDNGPDLLNYLDNAIDSVVNRCVVLRASTTQT